MLRSLGDKIRRMHCIYMFMDYTRCNYSSLSMINSLLQLTNIIFLGGFNHLPTNVNTIDTKNETQKRQTEQQNKSKHQPAERITPVTAETPGMVKFNNSFPIRYESCLKIPNSH